MPYQNQLLVEGVDDQHALGHLLRQHNLACTHFDETSKVVADVVAIKKKGSYRELMDDLWVEFRAAELRRLALVVDADTDLPSRWQSISSALSGAGGLDLPGSPPSDGWVGEVEVPTGRVRAGIWIMPDNRSTGALEEFAVALVHEDDELWTYAEACLDELPEKRFGEKDATKALVHTWLAWQDKPRLPLGLAVSRGYFDPHAQPAQSFVHWFRRVFEQLQ